MGIPSDWIKSIPEKERKDFEDVLRNSTYVLSRLQNILKEKVDNLDRKEVDLTAYENPSWAYLQAHLNGKRSGLLEALRLLEFLDQEKRKETK